MKIIKVIPLVIGLFVTSNMFVPCFADEQRLAKTVFEQAMEHIEHGQWAAAETLLSYQLSQTPEQHRVRLELALTQMQLAKYSDAKTHLLALQKISELPDNVRFNIDLLLNEINQRQQTEQFSVIQQWGLIGSLAMGYDDNVRFSFGDYFLDDDPFLDSFYFILPDGKEYFISKQGYLYSLDGEIVMPDELGIDLTPFIEKPNTNFIESAALIKYNYFGKKINWKNNFLVRNIDNADFSDYDKLLYKLDSELIWPLSSDKEIGVQFEQRNQFRGGQPQIKSSALTLGYRFFFDSGEWHLYGQYMDRSFETIEVQFGDFSYTNYGFDNKSWALGVEWNKLFYNNRLLAKVQFELKNNDASDGLKYQGGILKTALVYQITDDWSAASYVHFFQQDYNLSDLEKIYGLDESNDVASIDKSLRIGTKIDYQLNEHLSAFLSADWGERSSDIYWGVHSSTVRVKLGFSFEF
ncbi:hypothetical protein [Pseudoalteromonas sp.]|uniref:hypothetical protein n=1 Tax=Pseudoalteromonas sp. TaxID=53249 RepID=UPI0035639B0B